VRAVVNDRPTNLPNRPSAEGHYSEHVQISSDERADNELLRVEDIKEFASAALRIVGAVMVMVSCALLVYLTGVLLARVVLWAYLP
jgi:hypothetical protein